MNEVNFSESLKMQFRQHRQNFNNILRLIFHSAECLLLLLFSEGILIGTTNACPNFAKPNK
jgi:hypothetical protein